MARYRLLCGETTDETVKEAQSHRFSAVSADHVLIYSDRRVKCRGLLAAADELMAFLSDEEKAWLRNSITEACMDRMDEKQTSRNNIEFMESFERELKAERERLAWKEAGADVGTDK